MVGDLPRADIHRITVTATQEATRTQPEAWRPSRLHGRLACWLVLPPKRRHYRAELGSDSTLTGSYERVSAEAACEIPHKALPRHGHGHQDCSGPGRRPT
jgi:hypothetical protein